MKQKTRQLSSHRLFTLEDEQQFSEYIRDLAWSPQGDRLAIISAGGELALWQDSKINVLQSNGDYSLDCLGFSEDGKWLATGGQTGEVQVWQLGTTPQLLTTLDEGTAWIDSLAWNPHHSLLAFAVNRQIKIWDAKTQKQLTSLDFKDSSVFSLAWHPQGNLLAASGHGGVKVWNREDWTQKSEKLEVPGASLDCSWSFTGQYLASGNLDRTISLLEWDSPPPWLMQGFPAKVSQITWSQDKNKPLLAASCQEGVTVWRLDSQSKNWENQILEHKNMVQAIAFAPNSSLLASTGDDAEIKLWQKGKKLVQILKGVSKFSCLAWHPTGQYLAAGEQNGEVKIWQRSHAGQGFGY